MSVDIEKIEKAIVKLLNDPEIRDAVNEAKKLALEISTGKFKPDIKSVRGNECGGCFSCGACSVTPGIPDIEVGALLTAFYVAGD